MESTLLIYGGCVQCSNISEVARGMPSDRITYCTTSVLMDKTTLHVCHVCYSYTLKATCTCVPCSVFIWLQSKPVIVCLFVATYILYVVVEGEQSLLGTYQYTQRVHVRLPQHPPPNTLFTCSMEYCLSPGVNATPTRQTFTRKVVKIPVTATTYS